MPQHFREGLARRAATEQLHGAAAAEAVGAQPRDVDPHRGEGVRREGEEDVAADPRAEVGKTVEAGVLPLAVEGQQWIGSLKGGLVKGGGQGPDVRGPP